MDGGHGEESLATRIAHKLHLKHDKDHLDDEKENGKPLHDRPNPHPRHKKVEGYVESGVHAGFVEILDSLNQQEVMDTVTKLVKSQATVGVQTALNEGLNILGDDKGQEVIGRLVAAQAAVLAEFSRTDLGRKAAREGAMDAVAGSYDAVEKKSQEWIARNKLMLQLGGVAAALFVLPIFLALWRFVLFGWGPGSSQCGSNF